jgi:demethylmenaquinone methyltransferase/2-methoxy-6-polyprenyl-1,4-benzoquinol methylase
MPTLENAMSDERRDTNQTFYDRISQAYDFIADSNERQARETGERALEPQPGDCILEIGFGTGNSVLYFADSVGPQGHVCGVDVSPGMLAVAERKVADKGFSERVDLRVGDARELPYEDARFDAAFMSMTLELFPQDDIPVVLAEVRRVLRVGGRLGVVSMATVPEGEDASALEKTYVWMHRHFPHIVDCRPIDVVRLLGDAEFGIQSEQDLEIWTMPVKAVVGIKQ